MKKTIIFLLSILYASNAIAVSETSRPYVAGSVFNLSRYLPWVTEAPEIVQYPTGCSVNDAADTTLQLFFPEGRGSFSKVFHAECVRHDLCYRHGYYTYQFTKDDCDEEFAQGLESRCVKEFVGSELDQCRRVADVLDLAARKFGHLSYHADDYPFRDYGYYYEYLDDRPGQFSLLWSLLDAKADRYRELYRRIINGNRPLPPQKLTHQLLVKFFRKEIGLKRLIRRLKGATDH